MPRPLAQCRSHTGSYCAASPDVGNGEYLNRITADLARRARAISEAVILSTPVQARALLPAALEGFFPNPGSAPMVRFSSVPHSSERDFRGLAAGHPELFSILPYDRNARFQPD